MLPKAIFFFGWISLSAAAASPEVSLNQLNDCNWLVSYRGRTYDLAPLTREALSRPIETDIRYALQRVPESAEHLNRMTTHMRDARAHAILASGFASVFLVSRVLRSGEKNNDRRAEFNIASYVSAGFFGAAALFSWKSTTAAKQELVNAVSSFNENSPNKIEPAVAGSQRPLAE